jgi:hypothetical protein
MPGTRLTLKKEPAAELAELCLRHGRELNSALQSIAQRDSADDLRVAKTIVGKLMGEIYTAALYPIFEDYPELKPKDFP